MAKQGTPRAVKRFINRLRYIATRLRKAAGREEGRFPEPDTVALAAIHFFNPEWLGNGSKYRLVTDGKIDGLLEPGEDVKMPLDDGRIMTLSGSLAECVDAYANWTAEEGLSEKERLARGSWKPSEEHRTAFLAVISEKSAAG